MKTLLLWLVMAALPLQGFAAAIQVSCAAGHHAAAAMAPVHDMQAGQRHEAHQHEAHQHEASQQDAHQHAAGAVQQTAKTAKLDPGSDTGHTSCASCYLGVAMAPPLSIASPGLLPSQAVVISHPEPELGYVPPNLERPPKHVSA